MRDMRGGEQNDAQLDVVAVVERGVMASASASEIFNTAVLDDVQLFSDISAFTVYSWYKQADSAVSGARQVMELGCRNQTPWGAGPCGIADVR